MQIPMIKSDIGFYPNILFWCMSKEWLKDRDMNRVVAKDQIEVNNKKRQKHFVEEEKPWRSIRAENGKNVKSARRNVPKLTFSLIC